MGTNNTLRRGNKIVQKYLSLIVVTLLLSACSNSAPKDTATEGNNYVKYTICVDTLIRRIAPSHLTITEIVKEFSEMSNICCTLLSREDNYQILFFATDSAIVQYEKLTAHFKKYNDTISSYVRKEAETVESQLQIQNLHLLQLEQELRSFRFQSGFNEEPIPLSYTIDSLEKLISEKRTLLDLLQSSLPPPKSG